MLEVLEMPETKYGRTRIPRRGLAYKDRVKDYGDKPAILPPEEKLRVVQEHLKSLTARL